jgi:IS5 family transposase
MKRGGRNHPIGIWDKLRYNRISKKRFPGERSCAVIKTVFKSAHTLMTITVLVHVKMVFAAISFNLGILITFKQRGVI